MIRNITKDDAAIIKQLIGIDIEARNDVIYECSGISFNERGEVDSLIIFGSRSLTEYYNGNVPDDDYMDDSEGSEEIIAFYSADGTDNDMYKTYPYFARYLSYMSQMWYIPKDEEDMIKAEKCMNMSRCKNHKIMIKTNWYPFLRGS